MIIKRFIFIVILFVLSAYQLSAQKQDTLKKSADTTRTLKEVIITGKLLQEEIKAGKYNQPEWTTSRRFSTTRVYLQQPPGSFGIEQWVKAQYNKGEAPDFLFQEEFEIGLPGRLQFDIYENWIRSAEGIFLHDNVSAEVRWALAEWGKIPCNPTLYLEWKFKNPDLGKNYYETKILFGDELAKRWHWGLNLYYEKEISGLLTMELGLSQGISYTLFDKALSIGEEMKIESETVKYFRTPVPLEVDLGPSIQWRPTHNIHLDIVPLIGLTKDSPRIEGWLVLGFDFGKNEKNSRLNPISTKSR